MKQNQGLKRLFGTAVIAGGLNFPLFAAPQPKARDADLVDKVEVLERGNAKSEKKYGIEIGLRTAEKKLDVERGDFLGSINYHEVVQGNSPEPYARFWAPKFLGVEAGVELSKSGVESKTITEFSNPVSDPAKNDGNIVMDGATYMLLARFPISIPIGKKKAEIIPALGIGKGKYDGTVNIEDWWHYGFTRPYWQDYLDWVAAGKPANPNNGYTREMWIEDADAGIKQAELGLKFSGFNISAYWRETDIEEAKSWFKCYAQTSKGKVQLGGMRDSKKNENLSYTTTGVQVSYGFSF